MDTNFAMRWSLALAASVLAYAPAGAKTVEIAYWGFAKGNVVNTTDIIPTITTFADVPYKATFRFDTDLATYTSESDYYGYFYSANSNGFGMAELELQGTLTFLATTVTMSGQNFGGVSSSNTGQILASVSAQPGTNVYNQVFPADPNATVTPRKLDVFYYHELTTNDTGRGSFAFSSAPRITWSGTLTPTAFEISPAFGGGGGPAAPPVPEPGEWAMMIGGLSVVGFARRRKGARS